MLTLALLAFAGVIAMLFAAAALVVFILREISPALQSASERFAITLPIFFIVVGVFLAGILFVATLS